MNTEAVRFGRQGWIVLLLACCLLLAPQVLAQTVTGTLSGHVADKTGAVVPNAQIKVVNTSTGAVREGKSNESGYYLVSFLPIGTYNVTATASGFRTLQKTSVLVELNQTTISDFALDVASASTEIEVRGGEIPLIDTTSGEIKTGLDENQITNTPLTGRNFISLVEQVPGFQPAAFNGSSNNPTNSTGSYASFAGQGTRSTTFQIDGVNNDDSSENQNRQGVNVSAIKEVQVLTNGYSAEFGRAGGAVILVQTKSGTNSIHGDAYDFIQNDLFNANDFYSNLAHNKRSRVRRNQYGGTVGGPILKNKLFFFGSGERVSNVGKNSMSRFVWLPSDAPHACAPGEVSKPGGPYCVDPATHPHIDRDIAYIKSVMSLWDTPELKGKAPNDPLSCTDLINSGRPNRCVRVDGLSLTYPDSDYSGRLDWITDTNTNMNVRYQYSRQIRSSPRLIEGDNFGTVNNRQYNIAYTLTHVYSSRQTGEFRYGFGNRRTNQNVTDSNSIPIIRFGTTLTNPAASSDYLGYAGTVIGTSANVPINRWQRDHQFVYNHTIVLGRHTLKFGIDQRFSALDDIASGTQRGYWQFYGAGYTTAQQKANINTADSGFIGWELFLMGIMGGQYQKGYGQSYAQNRFHETNLYAVDSFRVTPSLTLNLGARWEGVSAPHELKDRFSYGYKGDWNNIEPRVGFAWSPTWDSGFLSKISGHSGDFVVRGAYGLYHDRVFQSVFSQSGLNFRYQPPNGYFLSAYPTVCATNPGGKIYAPADGAAGRSIDGAQFEISDPTCGFQFVSGQANYSIAASGNGVKVAGGRLLTQLLLPDPGFHLPYVQQWNLTIERKLPYNMALQVGYDGNRGIGLPFFSGVNVPQYGITSPVVSVDVGGGNYQSVVFDRVCQDYSDPICVVHNTDGSINTASSGARRLFSSLTSGTASLADKGLVIVNGVPHGYISSRTGRYDERRPDPLRGGDVRLGNFALTYYNAMTVKLTKATSHGLTLNSFFTWSKTIDTGSETTYTGTDINIAESSTSGALRSLRGLSSFHQKYRFVVSANYELPWMKNQAGLVGRIVGGWNVGGVMTFASGLPFTVLAGYDVNLDGSTNDRPIVTDLSVLGASVANGRKQSPCPTSTTSVCPDSISQLSLPASAFLPVQTGGGLNQGNMYPLFPGVAYPTGEAPRNAFFQQGQKNVDMALNKDVHIAERFNLNMRFELYNVFNRSTFGMPARTVNDSATPLGRISSTINYQNYVNSARTTGARMGQLAIRLTF